MLPAVSILLVYAAIGMLVCAVIARSPAGPGFYRMILLVALACLGLGFGVRFGPAADVMPAPGTAAAIGYAVAVAGAIAFGVLLRPGEHQRFAPLDVAVVGGLVAVLTDAAVLGGAEAMAPAGRALYSGGIVSVVPAVGSVLFAMLLAHWYLIEPRMPIEPLQRVLLVFTATQFVILASLIAVVGFHWTEWTTMDGGLVRAFTLGNALFVFMRGFLGVLAPIGLAWMTWKTVEIRSIQSATGILYAAVVFVLFGSTISLYLSLATGQPY